MPIEDVAGAVKDLLQKGQAGLFEAGAQTIRRGRKAFALLDARLREDVSVMLCDLSGEEQERLVRAMRTVEQLLGVRPEPEVPYLPRQHEAGDMGWVVHRYGLLYNREYGRDESFETLVARIAADFIDSYDPAKERCWIAERDGENVGCVFCVKESDAVAMLRLLLVETGARGLGLGTRMVEECIRYARGRGHRRLTLRTNSVLDPARHIYEEKGFEIVEEEEHHSFGKDLIRQNWELKLWR